VGVSEAVIVSLEGLNKTEVFGAVTVVLFFSGKLEASVLDPVSSFFTVDSCRLS
jgi:hypothetical protein